MTRLPAAPYSYMSLFPPGLLVNWCFHTLGGLTSDLWMDKRFFLSQVRYWLLVSLQWTPSWQPSCDWKRPDDKFYRWNFRLYRSRARTIFILLLFISARLSAGCRFNRGNRKLVGRTRHTPTRLHVCWGKSSSSVVFCVLTENCGWRWKATDFLKTSERNAASLLQQFTSTEGSARHHPASRVRGQRSSWQKVNLGSFKQMVLPGHRPSASPQQVNGCRKQLIGPGVQTGSPTESASCWRAAELQHETVLVQRLRKRRWVDL